MCNDNKQKFIEISGIKKKRYLFFCFLLFLTRKITLNFCNKMISIIFKQKDHSVGKKTSCTTQNLFIILSLKGFENLSGNCAVFFFLNIRLCCMQSSKNNKNYFCRKYPALFFFYFNIFCFRIIIQLRAIIEEKKDCV